MTAPQASPAVSVIMANHRGAAHLERAMASVLAQTERRLELILADDASDDDSLVIARRIADQDPRVRVLASARNAGPAVTRNRALDMAEGRWIAIVDSDDLIHPERLARLIAAAEDAGVDMAADDLVHFGDVPEPAGRTLLQPMALAAPVVLGPAPYLRSNEGGSSLPRFGYLKPVIRRAALGGLRYDPGLRIGEDHDLVLRLMIGGARLLLVPDPLYAYRRHGGSISHRLSVAAVEAMLQALRALPPLPDPETRAAAAAVDRQLRRALRYERLVADIKARRWRSALPRLADPVMIGHLAESLRDRRRRAAAAEPLPPAEPAGPEGPLPVMPGPGRAWDRPPAEAAALVAAGAARGRPLPAGAPPWAVWLSRAAGGDPG